MTCSSVAASNTSCKKWTLHPLVGAAAEERICSIPGKALPDAPSGNVTSPGHSITYPVAMSRHLDRHRHRDPQVLRRVRRDRVPVRRVAPYRLVSLVVVRENPEPSPGERDPRQERGG